MKLFSSDKKPTAQHAHSHREASKQPTQGILRAKEASKEKSQAAAKGLRFAAKDELLTSHVDPATNRRMRIKTDAKPQAPIKAELRSSSACMVKQSEDGNRLVFWPNGQTYTGGFNAQGQPHGQGTLTLAEGPGKHAGPHGAGLASTWHEGKCISVEGQTSFAQTVKAYVAPKAEPGRPRGQDSAALAKAGAKADDAEGDGASSKSGRTLMQRLRR